MTLQRREQGKTVALAIPADMDLGVLYEDNFVPGMTPQFTRVKIPTGGSTTFTIEGAEGDEVAPAIEGAVVYHHRARGYWPETFSGGTPPVCSSLDGITGTGNPGGPCKRCPYNEWSSDPRGRKGKACKEMHRIYILRDNEFLPLLLSLPPTSLKAIDEFASLLLRVGRSVRGVRSSWSLTQAQNDDGIKYSEAVAQSLGVFDSVTLQKLRELSDKLIPHLKNISVMEDEYITSPSEGDDFFAQEPSPRQAAPAQSPSPRQPVPVQDPASRQPTPASSPASRQGPTPLLTLVGVLQEDPEMRYTASGKAVTSCWIQPDGDMKGYRVVAWEDQAERFNELTRRDLRIELQGIWRPVFNAPDQQEFVIKNFTIMVPAEVAPVQEFGDVPAVQEQEDAPPDWLSI